MGLNNCGCDDAWDKWPALPLKAWCELCVPIWTPFDTLAERDAHIKECHQWATNFV